LAMHCQHGDTGMNEVDMLTDTEEVTSGRERATNPMTTVTYTVHTRTCFYRAIGGAGDGRASS
ncbi:hypothetical protein HispidOSU_008630, partial [Sigmodon hispidus]